MYLNKSKLHLGHKHEDAGHNHKIDERNFGDDGGRPNEICYDWNELTCQYTSAEIQASKADIQHSKTGVTVGSAKGARIGSETRPRNMIVHFIIKIY